MHEKSKVLFVDDDLAVLEDNRKFFEDHGYIVLTAQTAQSALEKITASTLDCVVLDVDLPDESGFEMCIRIRQKTTLPIVFLSGYTEEYSRIKGLSIGGDDYVCKPYSLTELELRVRARIRSGKNLLPPKPLIFDELYIDPGKRLVTYGIKKIELSTFEFDLLYLLACYPSQVFSYEQIFEKIWNAPMNKGIKSLQMLIVRIRQKLNEVCPEHEYIQTIRRKGYLFVSKS